MIIAYYSLNTSDGSEDWVRLLFFEKRGEEYYSHAPDSRPLHFTKEFVDFQVGRRNYLPAGDIVIEDDEFLWIVDGVEYYIADKRGRQDPAARIALLPEPTA